MYLSPAPVSAMAMLSVFFPHLEMPPWSPPSSWPLFCLSPSSQWTRHAASLNTTNMQGANGDVAYVQGKIAWPGPRAEAQTVALSLGRGSILSNSICLWVSRPGFWSQLCLVPVFNTSKLHFPNRIVLQFLPSFGCSGELGNLKAL